MSILNGQPRGRVVIVFDGGMIQVVVRDRVVSISAVSYGLSVWQPRQISFDHLPDEVQKQFYDSIVDEDCDVVWTESRPLVDDDGAPLPCADRWTRVPDKERLT